jgi:multisubunit Na+/H+ antiporter MnhE subunit
MGSTVLFTVVADATAVDRTVAYARRSARDAARELDAPVTLRVRCPDERTRTRVAGLLADPPGGVTVAVEAATDTERDLLAAVRATDPRVVLLDTGVDAEIERALRGAGVLTERVPVDRERRPRRLVHRAGVARFTATFLLSYGFYLALGDPTAPFDLVTGAASAGLVAALLAGTLFEEPPTVRRSLPRFVRAALFLPYLLWEVVRANLAVAAVVLRPSLPIDPATVEVPLEGRGRFERALLANAITLTPGTLSVDVTEEALLVHTLTAGSREELETGSLARAVRFVFEGRS